MDILMTFTKTMIYSLGPRSGPHPLKLSVWMFLSMRDLTNILFYKLPRHFFRILVKLRLVFILNMRARAHRLRN